MRPIALFDKSFLQSLNLDESLFFDHFFLSVVCPLFYVETLADLEKAMRQGRTPEQEVGMIAAKTPELHSALCANHVELCANSFLGNAVPMDGRVPRAGGKHVKVQGNGFPLVPWGWHPRAHRRRTGGSPNKLPPFACHLVRGCC